MKDAVLHFRHLFQRSPATFAAVAAGAIVQLAFTVAALSLFRLLFDNYVSQGQAATAAWTALGIVSLQILSSLVGLGVRRITFRAIRTVIAEYRTHLVHRLLLLPRAATTGLNRSDIHQRLVRDTETVGAMTSAVLNTWVAGVPVALLLVAGLTWEDWRFLAVLIVLAPVVLFVEWRWRPPVREEYGHHQEAVQQFSRGALFLADHLDLIRLQTAQDVERRRQLHLIDTVAQTNFRLGMRIAWADWGHSAGGLLIAGSVLALGAGLAAQGAISLGTLLKIYFAMALLQARIQGLMATYPTLHAGVRALAGIESLHGPVTPEPYSGSQVIPFTGRVALDNVHFGYPGKPVLAGVSLTVEPGTITVLMGPNGAGKTTLLHLLCGLYLPQSGRLLADGLPYSQLSIAALRSGIAVVPQTPVVFRGTILENIIYGQPVADEAAAREAAVLAKADSFIRELPGGYHATVDDRGDTLSGGQRQKLSLARALYRQPRLLILDEPTNHLDLESVRELADSLRRLPGAPAILVITHDEAFAACGDLVHRLAPVTALEEAPTHGYA